MRDIIWTVIIVWLIYKLITIFKSVENNKQKVYSSQNNTSATQNPYKKNSNANAIKKGVDKEGDYVDYEEIK
ncbi:MAG: DUF4834 family protein [Bacteroidetes bacterium]|nr:DUF4834 family protein [Bacteroidota bacterium]